MAEGRASAKALRACLVFKEANAAGTQQMRESGEIAGQNIQTIQSCLSLLYALASTLSELGSRWKVLSRGQI